MTEHWVILGASSSIARAFVRAVARRGAALTLMGRDPADLGATAADAQLRGASSARVLVCDATDAASRAAFLPQAALAGTVLNAFLAIGNMPDQDAMDSDPELLDQPETAWLIYFGDKTSLEVKMTRATALS